MWRKMAITIYQARAQADVFELHVLANQKSINQIYYIYNHMKQRKVANPLTDNVKCVSVCVYFKYVNKHHTPPFLPTWLCCWWCV